MIVVVVILHVVLGSELSLRQADMRVDEELTCRVNRTESRVRRSFLEARRRSRLACLSRIASLRRQIQNLINLLWSREMMELRVMLVEGVLKVVLHVAE